MQGMTMNQKIKRYSELILLPSFEERFEYLKLGGAAFDETFGSKRYLNQALYKSEKWKSFRREIIIRDKGFDLGIADREIFGTIIVHHINPLSVEDILNHSSKIFDEENVITTCIATHNAIHYGDISKLMDNYVVRERNDTCPWKK